MPSSDATTKTRRLLAAVGSLAMMCAAGCGSVQVVLKGPVSDRCVESGLKGCSAMVDGVIAYVEGDKADAEERLRRTAAQNAPDKVQQFAATLPALGDLPGAESYVAPIREVVDLLARSAKGADHTKRGRSARATADDQVGASAVATETTTRLATADDSRATMVASAPRHEWSNADFTRMRTKTLAPATDGKGMECNGPLAVARWGACTRIAALAGPFVVTDLYSPGGCGDDLFVYVDGQDSSSWIVLNAGTQSLNMHGVQLVVGRTEKLYVGARTDKGPLRNDSLRCSVMLSGWGPEEEPRIQYLDVDGF
jgi:hypothetical protein